MSGIRCDIIIPVFNKADLTQACVESICRMTEIPFTLTIVDNASDAPTKSVLRALAAGHAAVRLVENGENRGWVKAVNQGIALSTAPYLCIMNNDTIVRTTGWLTRLIAVAESAPDVGLVNPAFDLRESAVSETTVELDFCRGYCILIKRAVIEKIGGLDEAYGLGYYDDDDYSVRAIRAGFRCLRANGVVVEHLRDSTFAMCFRDEARRALHEKNKELFYARWGRRLRIVLIVSDDVQAETIAAVARLLARRQHIVYLWSGASRPDCGHINIRIKRLPLLSMLAMLAVNRLKRPAKRYDLVLTDRQHGRRLLALVYRDLRPIDFAADPAILLAMVDRVARGDHP